MPPLVRLHISPLTEDTLSRYLAPSVIAVAQNIEYHTIETFPENNYGFVTLPTMEASKLRKKLDGTIFKGKKVKIVEARKKKEPSKDVEDEEQISQTRGQKRKRENGLLEAHELPGDRKVKRGWAEPMENRRDRKKQAKEVAKEGDKKKRAQKSEYTDKPEMLFKTKVPENKKDAAKATKRKNKNRDGTTTVHEFEKTTKHPSFLRSGPSSKARDQPKPKPTVNEHESSSSESSSDSEPASPKVASRIAGDIPTIDEESGSASEAHFKIPTAADGDDETSSSGSLSESESDEEQTTLAAESTPVPVATSTTTKQATSLEDDDETSSSGSSSADLESDSKSTPAPLPKSKANPRAMNAASPTKGKATSGARNHADAEALEGLFKKPAPVENASDKTTPAKNLTIDPTPFSFFSNDANSDDGSDADNEPPSSTAETPGTGKSTGSNISGMSATASKKRAPKPLALAIPATPHTTFDRQFRAQRSAAPTPDTAHPDKKGFKDWFYENRGENNRAWKKRRRDTLKEERRMKRKK